MSIIGYNTSATVDSLTDGRGFSVGDCFTDHDGVEWRYVKAAEALTQYDWVAIDESYNASQLTATEAGDGYMVGVAQVAFAADDYGWVAIRGPVTARVGASCGADSALYTSGTAGVLDDATSGTKIDGVVATTANAETVVANESVLLTFPRSATF